MEDYQRITHVVKFDSLSYVRLKESLEHMIDQIDKDIALLSKKNIQIRN